MADTTYYATVAVIKKSTNTGISGVRVNAYDGEDVYTGNDGKATVSSTSSSTSIYVNGFEVYNGSFSSAPKPILVYKD